MLKLYLLLQQVSNYEDIGIKSLLIATIIALGTVIVYLYKSINVLNKDHDKYVSDLNIEHYRVIKEKDDKILEVIKNHHLDIKENTKDVMAIVDKYHQFTQTIKDLVNGNRGNE